MKQINYIDIFAGTSALSEGFKQAGFNPVAHVEMDKDACNTIKTRIAYHYLKAENKHGFYYDYVCGETDRKTFYASLPDNLDKTLINCEISDVTKKYIFAQIADNLKNQCLNSVDLIVGGPPCQGYSQRSRFEINPENDKRLHLYIQYGYFLKEFTPKVFIFENVLGLLNFGNGKIYSDILEHFRQAGYEVDSKVLNACDYGVLQNRKRLFLVGWRKDLKFSFPSLKKIIHTHTLGEILDDLSPLKPGENIRKGRYSEEAGVYAKRFGIRDEMIDFYTQHFTRPHNENDRNIYKLAIVKWENEKKRLKYPDDIPERLHTQRNKSSFFDRFKVVDRYGLSHTIIAHIAKDGHYYIHPDVSQCRSLSVREAARIQSFPDSYFFEGSRSSIFRQIGNAVPPLLSMAFAGSIKKQFNEI